MFGALGPFMNKLATFDSSSRFAKLCADIGFEKLHFVFDVGCILLMLFFNTLSVKYKLLSYKNDGAFLGTTLIFSLGYLFSVCLGFVIAEEAMPLKRYLGVLLMVTGVMLVSATQFRDPNSTTVEAHKMPPSILEIVRFNFGEEDNPRPVATSNLPYLTEACELKPTSATDLPPLEGDVGITAHSETGPQLATPSNIN